MTTTHADIERMLPYVRSLVVNRFRTVPRNIADHDDLIQVGMLAIIEAAPRYDPDRGATFATYAITRARGGILDHLRYQRFGGRLHQHEFDVVPLDMPLPYLERDIETLADTIPDQFEFDDPIQRDRILEHATAGLNDRGRHAFHQVIVEDRSAADTARNMGVSQAAVSLWLKAAREAVEPLLAEAA